jgi:hypothetical protein
MTINFPSEVTIYAKYAQRWKSLTRLKPMLTLHPWASSRDCLLAQMQKLEDSDRTNSASLAENLSQNDLEN